ncbi:hypothetical protein [Microbacterium sp. K41]|uniref:hypothetical protein n=1 Tax=Microbacterium sp. K41 TaxID=2305437 RepID=UPI00109D0213|nr:hypothetical protein [Microbacterium sp. K41]
MEAGAIVRFKTGETDFEAFGDRFRGLGFHLVDLAGWTESPEVVRERIKRPTADGTFPTPVTFDERTVRMSGFMVAANHTKLEHSSAWFRGLAKASGQLIVEDAYGEFWTPGKVTAARFANHGFAPEGQWSLEVVAEDPRKYGQVRPYPAGTPAVHFGTSDAVPRLLVGAGSGGYTVTGPGGRVVTVPSPPNAAHVISFAEGGLFLNGVRQVGAISVLQPWVIPAGIEGVTATITGARTLTHEVTDTF